ncbi:uncharacterized protein LOC122952161 [Acropora millepora]|uniref:uncharacterized protein LOC122952161 n=1 Tax=Acropora millepora TaxID=45264 RepID=UPI001CF1A4CD|nr:uncharacterized protein LOC122952161 [Acropora millepora]
MFVTLNFVPLFLAILLCCPESETASTAFTTRPSDPSYAVEGRDFTLEWTYTLDGPVISVQFSKESVSGTASIIGKTIGEGNLTFFDPKYQVHFKGQATNHRTELTILAVQRSDEAKYHLYVTPNGTGSLHHEVAVIVQSDPTLTVAPSTTISQQGFVCLLTWTNCVWE